MERKGLIKASNGIYYYKFKQLNGKFTQKSLGTKDFDEAVKKFDQFVETVHVIEQSKEEKHLKISDLYKRFYDYYQRAGKKNPKTLMYPLLYLQEFANDCEVNKFSKYQAEMFLIHRQSSKKTLWKGKKLGVVQTDKLVSKTTISIEFRFLKQLFNKSRLWNLCLNNPFEGLKLPKSLDKKKKTLSHTEIFSIVNACDNEKFYNCGTKEFEIRANLPMKRIILLSYIAGFRISEITNLVWENVDFAERVIHIRNIVDKDSGETTWATKTRMDRTVPMNDEIYNILIEQKELTGHLKYVFGEVNPKTGIEKPMTKDRVSAYFKRKVRECGISDDIHFHCLRHCSVSNKLRAGIPPIQVMKIHGHTTLITTMKYAHVELSDLREAMNMATFPKGF